MMRWLLISLCFLLLTGCKERYTWYQKTVVTVETPDGPKSGEGVVGVNLSITKRQTIAGGYLGWRYWGEAAVVDLGKGKYVFALMNRPRGSWYPDVTVRKAFKRAGVVSHLKRNNGWEWHRSLVGHKVPVELVKEEFPTLVAFRDLNEPSSIIELEDNTDFETVFGPGYGLANITLEVSRRSKVPESISTILPWIQEKQGWFTSYGKPCDLCSNAGQFTENPAFSDFVNRKQFLKSVNEKEF